MADLEVNAVVADRGIDVDFVVAPGEVLAVLGANGAGKSSVAAIVAGLLPARRAGADRVLVRAGGRTLTDTAAGVSVPVHDRRIGLLQQDPLLFPHLDVRRNVAFGSRFGGHRAGRRSASAAADRWLSAVGAEGLAGRTPAELSGGQAQRVAIARALAAQPEVLILDEPLAGLDVAAAEEVRVALRGVVAGSDRATVLITHDVPDVIALADRVMVMESGRVAEVGPVVDVLAAPRSRFGARIAGLNLIRGVVRERGVLVTVGGRDWFGTGEASLQVGADAVAVFAPTAVAVFREPPVGSPRNVIPGRIAAVQATGTGIRLRLEPQPGDGPGLAADVTAAAVAELGLRVGRQVCFAVKSQAVTLHPGSRRPVR